MDFFASFDQQFSLFFLYDFFILRLHERHTCSHTQVSLPLCTCLELMETRDESSNLTKFLLSRNHVCGNVGTGICTLSSGVMYPQLCCTTMMCSVHSCSRGRFRFFLVFKVYSSCFQQMSSLFCIPAFQASRNLAYFQ